MITNNKTFISYAWKNHSIDSWIGWFTELLRKYEIDAHFDKGDVQPGDNLQKFMEEDLPKSKSIIIIMTDEYIAKSFQQETGVYKELELIKRIMKESNKNTKVYILKDINLTSTIPKPLDDIFYLEIDISKTNNMSKADKKNFSTLIRVIQGNPEHSYTPLKDKESEFQKWLKDINAIDIFSSIIHNAQFNTLEENEVEFDFRLNSGVFTIGTGNQKTEIMFTGCGYNSLHIYNDYISTLIHITDDSITNLSYFNHRNQIHDILMSKETRTTNRTFSNIKASDIFYLKNKNGVESVIQVIEIKNPKDEVENHYIKISYKFLLHTDIDTGALV